MYYLKEKKTFYKLIMLSKYAGKFGKLEKATETIAYHIYFSFVHAEL